MNFQDSGIIIAKKPQGESSYVLTVLTAGHGLHKGLIRQTKSNRAYLEPGVIHKVTWQARLSEHLGSWTLDPSFNPLPIIMSSPLSLLALNSACDLVLVSVPERDPCPKLYNAFADFLHHLSPTQQEGLPAYCLLECEMVRTLGLPLQFNKCAVTGGDNDLVYVSPRSGRAVSKDAAFGYESKLLPLPFFLKNPSLQHIPSQKEIIDALSLSEYFLTRFILEATDKEMPHSRRRLKATVQ